MKSQEIRETFLDFFFKKNHKIIKSSSLLPKDDPTLLFTNAGMNQFKNVFLGLEKRSYKKTVSVQKCLRVSGKHNDLEQVGKTNKHHTFFEMLGNFSFGDYFKEEAVEYAWKLITQVFKINKEKIYITVYLEDEEAFRIWNKEIGISSDKIFRLGKKDNYWAMGETGPCGPCSEIYYDLDSEIEKGDPFSLIEKGSNRFLELWNLVFMQYYKDEKGNLFLLPSPSIDTGMGLERLAAVLQKKKSNFESDLFAPLIEAVGNISCKEYPSNDEENVCQRIISDHIRAICFLIGDGIMPSNDGRGYVLRKLIRRAFRCGNILGIKEPFLYKLVGLVTETMKDAYPELLSLTNYISEVCLSEERRFAHTLSSGIHTFIDYIEETKRKNQNVLSGKKLFKLYDTYGFPLDLSKELAEEKKISIDEEGFNKELEKQRQRARLSWRGEDKQKEKKTYESLKDLHVKYVGYENEKVYDSNVIALMKKGKMVQLLKEKDSGEIFLDVTPFYAEAGGQVGDSGILKNPHFSAVVKTSYYPIPGIVSHKINVISGKVSVGDIVEASVNIQLRNAMSKNHTATHLLHASLRQILGDHIKQAGSLVTYKKLRFDFTHFSPLGSPEIMQVESIVNEKIRENFEVETKIVSLEEGIKQGAMAIFEEKYAEKVRMVTIDNFSKELCGGIHVRNTGEIGLFKIISETGVASGMRRIEALTGEEALKYCQETENLLENIQQELSYPRNELLKQINKLTDSLKEKEKENKALRRKLANTIYSKKEEKVRRIKDINVIIQKVEGLNNTELRELSDSLKQKIGSGIVVLGMCKNSKVFLVVSVTKDLVHRIKADELIKKISPIVGGGGGGRQDFAQAGGSKTELLDEALDKTYTIIKKMI